MTSRLPPWPHLLATIAGFGGSAVIANMAFGTVTPIWFSNAILAVALLLHPVRTWPAFLLPCCIADAASVGFFGQGPPLAVGLIDMFEATTTAALIRATGGVHMPIFQGRQLARIMLFCMAVPLASAFLGTSTLVLTEHVPFYVTWRTWYLGSALGMVIVCPFVLSWADPAMRTELRTGLRVGQLLLLAGGALLAACLVATELHDAAMFLSFPVLLALTWSFGLLGATLGLLATSVAALWATLGNHGGIARLLAEGTQSTTIEGVQIYMVSILLSSLPLAVLRARQIDLTHKLERAVEARAEFLAAMSHEIRTPMTGVMGLLDLLASDHLSAHHRRYVEAMRASGRYLLNIINDILDFSRIESGRLELEQVDFSVADLLERLRSMAHPLAVERGLALRIDQEHVRAGVLRGDPLRLQQVLVNLVGNAIKFTEQGRVTVAVTTREREDAPGTWLRAEVRDTGVGIEPAQLRKLFAAFTQADRSVARQYGGTGLGLAISKRLVNAMGGQIDVASVPGQGSVFAFEVPLQAGDAAHIAPQLAARAGAGRPLRILLAEDVEINREILSAALGPQGHALAFASNGAEALDLLQRESFDVVLMDVQMPVMDGVEATRRIRALPGPAARVPILGLTANVMARERERYLGAGMDDCLPKPIDWDLLHAALARHAGAAPPPAPQGEARMEGALLDEGALAALRNMAGDEELKELMRIGMGGYDAACDHMAAPDATVQTLEQQAHKLKGSSGTLGLAAVSRLAERIEQEAQQGRPARDLVPQLRATIAATRAELERRGVLRTA